MFDLFDMLLFDFWINNLIEEGDFDERFD